jgi:hypothetical protein
MPVAAPAIPPNPKITAKSANARKKTTQPNIENLLLISNGEYESLHTDDLIVGDGEAWDMGSTVDFEKVDMPSERWVCW